jgi:hypothetical protein
MLQVGDQVIGHRSRGRYFIMLPGGAQARRQIGDGHAGIAAGVDRLEGRQVHVHVQGEAVVAAAVLDAQPEGGDLGGPPSTYTPGAPASRAAATP